MKNRSIFVESEKKPGQLDLWSFILPIAFDLICGVLLIALGTLALRVTAYALAGALIPPPFFPAEFPKTNTFVMAHAWLSMCRPPPFSAATLSQTRQLTILATPQAPPPLVFA